MRLMTTLKSSIYGIDHQPNIFLPLILHVMSIYSDTYH
uniref:Uncharacterized protein n=1 Tax=Rhizophora mucronata TaxID=61149 RepID=A0A2P2N5N1_RHIMU